MPTTTARFKSEMKPYTEPHFLNVMNERTRNVSRVLPMSNEPASGSRCKTADEMSMTKLGIKSAVSKQPSTVKLLLLQQTLL